MSSLAFNPHRAVRALCEAGAAQPLAEVFVKTIGGNAVIKAGIRESEAALGAEVAEGRGEVADIQAELKTAIGLVRAEIGTVAASTDGLDAWLYRQLWLMMAGIVGLTVALVKLLG